MESSIRDFVLGIPLVTRFLFLGTLAVTIVGNWGLVNPYLLILTPAVYESLQIWRVVTSALFAGMLSFQFLMHLFMMYTYSRQLEQEQFIGRTADYIVFVAFSIVSLAAVGLLRRTELLSFQLTMVIIYLWSQLNKDRVVTFYFGTRFQARYLPYVMAAFQALIGGTLEPSITGIVVGHLYYLLEYDLPMRRNGVHWLQAPGFLLRWFPNMSVQGGFGAAPTLRPMTAPGQVPPPTATGSYQWRGGQRLGGAAN